MMGLPLIMMVVMPKLMAGMSEEEIKVGHGRRQNNPGPKSCQPHLPPPNLI